MPRCVSCERDFVDEVALISHQMYSLNHSLNAKSSSHLVRSLKPANEGIPRGQNRNPTNERTYTRLHTCGHCTNKNFRTKHDLEQHTAACHSTPTIHYALGVRTTTSSLQHGFVHNQHGFPCVSCNPPCGRKFETPEALNTHHRVTTERLKQNVVRNTKNNWSVIQETPAAIEKLRSMTHSVELLEKSGYKLEPLTKQDIMDQRKCINCHEKHLRARSRGNTICRFHAKRSKKRFNLTTGIGETYFPCCNQVEGPDCESCVVNTQHIYGNFDKFAEKLTILKTPTPTPGIQKRKAVALDCEMGTSYTNSSELIQLCVVDYFTGELLIDMLVRPKVELRTFNTKYSGVTREMMARAITAGEYLNGVEGARNELFKWIDSTTILIGHSLHCDLRELQLAHPLIVDSILCIPRINASGNSLKTLMKELLGRSVQDSKSGHDCVEDALASRELVIWCIQNADLVAERAIISRKEEEIRRKEREANDIIREERQRLKWEQRELERSLESPQGSSGPAALGQFEHEYSAYGTNYSYDSYDSYNSLNRQNSGDW